MAEIHRKVWKLLPYVLPFPLPERQPVHCEGMPKGMERWFALMPRGHNPDLAEQLAKGISQRVVDQGPAKGVRENGTARCPRSAPSLSFR